MAGRIVRPEVGTRLPFPRIGKIKIGYKDPKGFPRSVDYFIPTGKYAALFTQAYGEKPQTIQIMFPKDDPAAVCDERYEYRDDEGRLIASGDGLTFRCWNGAKKKYEEYNTMDYPNLMAGISKKYPNRIGAKNDGNGWMVVLSLRFMLPMVRGILGVWEFTTKGTESTIPNIVEAFDAVREINGHADGVIFDLSVEFAKSSKPGDASRYPVVSLVPNHSEQSIDKVKQSAPYLVNGQKQLGA